MFRESDTQRPLFNAGNLMTPEKQALCEKSWAGPFRTKALPLLLKHEKDFADLFDPNNGRPNRPVALVVGTLILKEMFDLTDEEALAALDFDMRWMYAFDLRPEELHLCQKTLHNFRAGMMQKEKSRLLFRSVTADLIEALGIKIAHQRMDSAHILSNIAVLTRLGLFCESLRVFLAALKKKDPTSYLTIPQTIVNRYADPRYSDTHRKDTKRRLGVSARDLYRLVTQFENKEPIKEMPEFKLLVRLLQEHCEITDSPQDPKDDDEDAGEGPIPVQLKRWSGSSALQSPHDPDLTFSGHKGVGYEVQLAETCESENSVQLITAVDVTPSCVHDSKATLPMLEELKEQNRLPDEMAADTHFGGAQNAAQASQMGVNLLCPAQSLAQPKPGIVYEKPQDRCPTDPQAALIWLTCQHSQANFYNRYKIRAGIEGTISECRRAHGLKKLTVRGKSRVYLSVILKTVACNMKRALKYWMRPPDPVPAVAAI